MAAKKSDLTARRFGMLLVLEEGDRIGRDRMWRAQCDCGGQDLYPHRRLTQTRNRLECCVVCRAIPCKACGAPVRVVAGLARYCSTPCRVSAEQAVWRASAAKQRADPEKKAKQKAKRQAKRAHSYLGRLVREDERAYEAKRRLDPERAEKDRAKKRLWYAKRREVLKIERQAAREALSPEERENLDIPRRDFKRGRLALRRILDAANPERVVEGDQKATVRRRERRLAEPTKEARTMPDGK